eukprot:1390244-Amphidinium_carterae.1
MASRPPSAEKRVFVTGIFKRGSIVYLVRGNLQGANPVPALLYRTLAQFKNDTCELWTSSSRGCSALEGDGSSGKAFSSRRTSRAVVLMDGNKVYWALCNLGMQDLQHTYSFSQCPSGTTSIPTNVPNPLEVMRDGVSE